MIRRECLALAALLLCVVIGAAAHAAPRLVKVYPTAIERASASPEATAGSAQLSPLARQLDAVLAEAIKDLGLTPLGPEREPELPIRRDEVLYEPEPYFRVLPLLGMDGSRIELEILVIAPGSQIGVLGRQKLVARDLEVRAMVMLKKLVNYQPGARVTPKGQELPVDEPEHEIARPRSSGRAIVALGAAALGGYIGFSLQRASGSNDPRLVYPLTALGAGVGLGASMIVADEWDIGVGDAWQLVAGALWPTISGLSLARSYDVAIEDRFIYGLVGATTGVSLAALSLTFGHISEGGALLTHSGGVFGTFLGGIAQRAIDGSTEQPPVRGMGYGAATGVLAAGFAATQAKLTASRVLLVDLAASLGALTGAAAASPILLVDDPSSETRERIWLSGIGAGTIAGGILGWLLTTDDSRPQAHAGRYGLAPYFRARPDLEANTRDSSGPKRAQPRAVPNDWELGLSGYW